jgi:hypothetical protein
VNKTPDAAGSPPTIKDVRAITAPGTNPSTAVSAAAFAAP